MTEWKVLDSHMRSCHGGSADWTPGERQVVAGILVPCLNGIHICRDERDLLIWLGEVVCPVIERSEHYIDAADKRVCTWVIIGEPNQYWNPRTAQHFACDCAEYTLRQAPDDQRELLQAIIDACRASADWPQEWAQERPLLWSIARHTEGYAAMVVGWAAGGLYGTSWAAVTEALDEATKTDLAAILATYLDGTNEWVVSA